MNIRYLILCAVILSGVLAYLVIVPSCDFDNVGKRKYSVREDWYSDTLSPAALSATAYNVDRKATRAASSPTPTRHPDTITATAEVWATKAANSRNYTATRRAELKDSGYFLNATSTAVASRKYIRPATPTPNSVRVVKPTRVPVQHLERCRFLVDEVIKIRLKDPGSMKENIHTSTPSGWGLEPNAGGFYRWRKSFTATNAFGARVAHTAHGTLNPGTDPPNTCDVRFGYIN